PPTGVVSGPLMPTTNSLNAVTVSSGSQSLKRLKALAPACTSIHAIRLRPPKAFCTAASNTAWLARQMSGPVPSPSMNGMMGRSGTWSRPPALRIGSPGGTLTVEKAGIGEVKPETAGRRKRSGARTSARRRPASGVAFGLRGARERPELLVCVGAPVVAAREHLLEPHVQNDEQIPAAHLLELQAGDAVVPLAPADRQRL